MMQKEVAKVHIFPGNECRKMTNQLDGRANVKAEGDSEKKNGKKKTDSKWSSKKKMTERLEGCGQTR